MADYTPPSNGLPFNFDSRSGYSRPDLTSVNFNFGTMLSVYSTLGASITPVQSYTTTTYSYLKYCDDVAVLYGDSVQILRGKCHYGGIRDLSATLLVNTYERFYEHGDASITGMLRVILTSDLWGLLVADKFKGLSNVRSTVKVSDSQQSTINSSLKLVASSVVDIPSYVKASWCGSTNIPTSVGSHQPSDIWTYIGAHTMAELSSAIRGSLETQVLDLASYIGAHQHTDLMSRLVGSGSSYVSISSYLSAAKRTGYHDLSSQIGAHEFVSLLAQIKSVSTSIYAELTAYLSGVRRSGIADLSADLSSHAPLNIRSSVRPLHKDSSVLFDSVFGYDTYNLASMLLSHPPSSISSSLKGVASAHADVHQSVYGWDTYNLTSMLGMHRPSDILSVVSAHEPAELNVSIRSWVSNSTHSIAAGVYGWQTSDLMSAVIPHSPGNIRIAIKGYVSGMASDMTLGIYGWDHSSVSGYIGVHQYKNLGSLMKARVINVPDDLPTNVHGWQEVMLPGRMSGICSPNITASVRGWNRVARSDLAYSIIGWQVDNITSEIGSHLPSHLYASVFPHAAPELSAIIKGWVYNTSRMVSANLHGWQATDLQSFSAAHYPSNLRVMLKAFSVVETSDVPTSIHGWDTSNIVSVIDKHLPSNVNSAIIGMDRVGVDVQASVMGYQKAELRSMIEHHQPGEIYSSVFGWRVSNVLSTVAVHEPVSLTAGVEYHDPSNILAYVSVNIREMSNVSSYLYGMRRKSESNVGSIVSTHAPTDINVSIRTDIREYVDVMAAVYGIRKSSFSSLAATIGTHSASNLLAFLKQVYKQSDDIYAHLNGIRRKSDADLHVVAASHTPGLIISYIRPVVTVPAHLDIDIVGIKKRGYGSMTSEVSSHLWKDLQVQMRINTRNSALLGATLRSFNFSVLTSNVSPLQFRNLGSLVDLIPGFDLGALLTVRPQGILSASMMVYSALNLYAHVKPVWAHDLSSSMQSHVHKNVPAVVRGYARSVESNIYSSTVGLTYVGLSVILRCKYMHSINSYLLPVTPVDIMSYLYGLQAADISADVEVVAYKYNLGAHIETNRNFLNLVNRINPILGVDNVQIQSIVKPFHVLDINSRLTIDPPNDLAASISSRGYTANLYSEIYPKYVRIITMISVITMVHSDMSAIINSSCRSSDYRVFTANLRCIYYGSIGAYVKCMLESPYSSNLGAMIGYSNTFYPIDKLELDINIRSARILVQDKLSIDVRIFGGSSYLSARINPLLMSKSIRASIYGVWIKPYEFELSHSREKVSHLRDALTRDSFEMVELSFKSIVKEYLFCEALGRSYKADSADRWVLNARSFVPRNDRLAIKRRFNRAKNISSISKFRTIDEAVRYMIDVVTERRFTSLQSLINISGSIRNLTCRIRTKYIPDNATIGGCIAPVSLSIFVRNPDNSIEKI